MTAVDHSLILENLEALRVDAAAIRTDLEDVKAALSRVESGIAAISPRSPSPRDTAPVNAGRL
jgi:hypothetical protein